ncbi:MAG: YkgJ family cysteine cluster protein [Proteobacteria bacterium]|nr:YkgJ family cysteine cluster protein [Pseudomonadota bacterium]
MQQNHQEQKINSNRSLLDKDTFKFECHSGVACFARCCRNADMYLYPYDIIRLKDHLGISSDQFLKQHTISAFRDNKYFPSLMLTMSDEEEKSCPFLSDKGCTIYKDRPFSCRAYPLERAVARLNDGYGRLVQYFVANHSYCLGHKETREWTVKKWTEDQQLQTYDEMNDLWVDIDTIFRRNPWGDKGINSPALKMAFLACFNVDKLKEFILDSSFLSRFDVPEERKEKIMESDIEMMKFGFDWVKYFLTSKGPLAPKVS